MILVGRCQSEVLLRLVSRCWCPWPLWQDRLCAFCTEKLHGAAWRCMAWRIFQSSRVHRVWLNSPTFFWHDNLKEHWMGQDLCGTYVRLPTYLPILTMHLPTYPYTDTYIHLCTISKCLANLFQSSKYPFDTLKSNTAPSTTEQPIWHIWIHLVTHLVEFITNCKSTS